MTQHNFYNKLEETMSNLYDNKNDYWQHLASYYVEMFWIIPSMYLVSRERRKELAFGFEGTTEERF